MYKNNREPSEFASLILIVVALFKCIKQSTRIERERKLLASSCILLLPNTTDKITVRRKNQLESVLTRFNWGTSIQKPLFAHFVRLQNHSNCSISIQLVVWPRPRVKNATSERRPSRRMDRAAAAASVRCRYARIRI